MHASNPTTTSYPPLNRRSSCSVAVIIFVISLVIYLVPGGSAPFFTRGEAREALVVRAMLDQHNFILPLRNGVDIPSKPPLYHWLAAGAAALFDSRAEILLRLPTSAAAALLLSCFFLIATRRLGKESALAGTLILATSLDFVRASAVTRVDMMFACWVSLGTWCLFELIESYFEKSRTDWPLLFLTSIVMSLAALSKGPAGIALPWIVAGIYALFRLPLKRLPVLPALVSVAISVAIASLWYVSAYRQGGQAFLDVHLMRENVARVVGMKDYDTGHKGNPLELPPMLLIGLFPWSIFVVPLLVTLYRRRREYLRFEEPAVLFCSIWALFYLVFFSLVASKRNVYLLPSFSAWAYLFAAHAPKLASRDVPGQTFTRGLFRAVFYLLAAIAIAICATFVYPPAQLLAVFKLKPTDLQVTEIIIDGLKVCLPFFVLALALVSASLKEHRGERFLPAAAYLSAGVLLLTMSAQLLVLRRIAYFESPRSFMWSVRAYLPPGEPLFQYRDDYYAANYYSDRDVTQVKELPELTSLPYGFMIASESALPDARTKFGQLDIVVDSTTLNVYGRDRFVFVRFHG